MAHSYALPKVFNQLSTYRFSLVLTLLFFVPFTGFGQTNDCSSPTTLTINSTCVNTPYDLSSFSLSTAAIPVGCSDNTWELDGYFTFTTSSTTTQINISTSAGTRALGLVLYQGNCATFTTNYITCNTPGTVNPALTAITVTPSTQYILRLAKTSNGGTATGNICIVNTTPAPPCNPPTVNAVTAITSTTATLNWAAASPAPTSGYQWEVRTSGAGGSGATGLTASGSVGAGILTANATGLTASTAYSVYVRSNCGSGNFSTWAGPRNFSTTAPGLANDNPCGAIALSSGCTAGTNVSSTPSMISPSNVAGCGSHSGNEDDVWYTYVVGASGSLEIEALTNGGSMTDPVIAVYSGTCSGSLNLIACDDDSGALALDAYLLLTGQTSGTTLYIRVWRYNEDEGFGSNGTFTMCINDVTDPCSSITNIASCGSAVNATIAAGNGNPLYDNSPCGFGAPGNELIYTFTPAVTGQYSITQNTTFDHINYAYKAAGTCSSTGWTCIADLTGNGQTSGFFTLTAGTQYFILLDSEITSGGSVNFQINCPPPPPPNDLCSDALDLVCGTIDAPGTTISATNVNHFTGCTMSNYGVWYTFVGDGDQTTITTKANSGFDHEMSISSGSCGSGNLTSIICRDANGAGGVESYTFITTALTTYYVYIANTNSGSTATGNFTITRVCTPVVPPPNDEPCTATPLNVNSSCVATFTTNEFATGSAGVPAPTPACGNYAGGDVWFTVTVPPNAQVTISTQSGALTDGVIAIYSGSVCGALTPIANTCTDNGSGMPTITLTAGNGIVPGQVLYIRFWEDGNNNNGTFSICAYSPIDPGTNGVTICTGELSQLMTSDLSCSGTTSLGNTINGNLNGATDPVAFQPQIFITSSDICNFDPVDTANYTTVDFTVTETGVYVFTIADNPIDLMGYIVVGDGLFTYGSCSTGTYIAGDDDGAPTGLEPQITTTLIAGVTYTLVTTAFGFSSTLQTGPYTWNITSQATEVYWYTAPTGGTPIASGSTLNPVGVSGSGITDTNTPGTWTYYVGCPDADTSITPRTPVDYVINPRPSATISGVSSGACGTTEITIEVTDASSTTDWQIGYSIDGGPTILFDPLPSNPYSFTAATAGTYTLVSAISYSTFCEALPGDLTGSATVLSSGAKTWTGSGPGTTTDWFNANNWSPVGVPNSGSCVIIPNTANDPIISGTGDGDAGTITVENGGNLSILAGGTLTVQNEVTVDAGGIFTLEGANGAADGSTSSISASLIQVNDVVNSGVITLDRSTFVRSRDYVYWSSPVENYAMTNIVNTQYIFDWEQTISGNPGQHGNWRDPAETTMIEGKGYIIQGRPQGNGDADNAAWNNVSFTGVPHNGVVTIPLLRGTFTGPTINNDPGTDDDITDEEDNWNLVGNPYPSALSADDFLTLNAQTNNRIEGTVYLWTHGTKIRRGNSPFFGDYVFNYDITDYLEYNLMGSPAGFDGFIGSGQGFFVLMDDASPSGTDLVFNNSMRNRTYENSVMFFREAEQRNSTLERHRIWLDIVDPNYDVSTILMGYIEGATMDKDKMFDAVFMSGSTKKIYTIIDGSDKKFSIQGRALPFEESDIISLGVIIDQLGEYVINIQEVDGLFENDSQPIFIEDLELGVIHNLKESPYVFTPIEVGEFTNRFQIVFTNNSLGVDDFITNTGISIIAPNSNYIKITSGNNPIASVMVYDLLGRLLIDKKGINDFELTINEVPKADGAYIVKATLLNGKQKIQKVVLRQ